MLCHCNSDCQICVSDDGMKNLARAKQQTKALQETKNSLFNYSWHLQKNGRNETTIITYTKRLQSLARFCDLNDPEEVKGIIATKYKNNSTKQVTVYAYDAYLKFIGKTWQRPNYKPEHKQVVIPNENELETAINTGDRTSIIFSKFLYETGARANEAERLEWADINTEKHRIKIKASKNGLSRTVTVPPQLIELLNSLPKNQDTVFHKVSRFARTNAFRNRMKRLARTLDNPRYNKIHLHTFRHCKALREYHKTRDMLHVKRILGHKNITTTMVYVDIYNEIYGDNSPREFVTKIASSKKERCDLINTGWELVQTDGEDWYFKKPK